MIEYGRMHTRQTYTIKESGTRMRRTHMPSTWIYAVSSGLASTDRDPQENIEGRLVAHKYGVNEARLPDSYRASVN